MNAQTDDSKPSLRRTLIIGRHPRRTLIRIATLVVSSFVLFKFVLLPVRISGISMYPTYQHSQINFVNRLAYLRSRPQRGDVVSIGYTGISIMLMKRIVGLPGERVAIKKGTVLINGQPLEEPYVKTRAPWDKPEIQLGPDEYFVIGDNRSMSVDNHFLGGVNGNKIVGKALF